MGMIGYAGQIDLWETDKETFNIIKARSEWTCQKCSKKIMKKHYCWGSGYGKYCIDCGLIVCDNMTKSLNEFKELVNAQKELCIENKEKYIENNILENL